MTPNATSTLPAPTIPYVLTALVIEDLASDVVLDAIRGQLASVRLVFPASDPQRCCAGHQPAFIAIDPSDPTLPERDRTMLATLAQGRAVPGSGLHALAGGIVALPGLSLAIDSPRDLGPGLARTVILTLSDAARALASAGPAEGMSPSTVAIVYGDGPPPPPWRVAARSTLGHMPLAVGLPDLVLDEVAA